MSSKTGLVRFCADLGITANDLSIRRNHSKIAYKLTVLIRDIQVAVQGPIMVEDRIVATSICRKDASVDCFVLSSRSAYFNRCQVLNECLLLQLTETLQWMLVCSPWRRLLRLQLVRTRSSNTMVRYLYTRLTRRSLAASQSYLSYMIAIYPKGILT